LFYINWENSLIVVSILQTRPDLLIKDEELNSISFAVNISLSLIESNCKLDDKKIKL